MKQPILLLLYALVLTFLLLLDFGLSLNLLTAWPLFLGYLLGTQFVWLDRIIYAYLHPQEKFSQQLASQLDQSIEAASQADVVGPTAASSASTPATTQPTKTAEAVKETAMRTSKQGQVLFSGLNTIWDTLRSRSIEHTKLSTQNVLFAAAWIPLAFFGLTSTVSWFGKGLVLGIGFQLAWRILQGLRGIKPLDWLFWPIKREVSKKEQLWVARAFVATFIILTLLI
jgi:hypothetical protein